MQQIYIINLLHKDAYIGCIHAESDTVTSYVIASAGMQKTAHQENPRLALFNIRGISILIHYWRKQVEKKLCFLRASKTLSFAKYRLGNWRKNCGLRVEGSKVRQISIST